MHPLLFLLLLTGPAAAQPQLDPQRVMHDVRVLSADSLQGRRTGSAGAAAARAYLVRRFDAIGLKAYEGSYEQPFVFRDALREQPYEGVNVVGYVEGTVRSDSFIVVSAHYDHLGVQNGQVYNGADDNASGVAGLLAAAAYFAAQPPRHTILFAAFDAEELGLQGAEAFLRAPPVAADRIVLNVNLDMISRSETNELFAAGTYHYPFLRPFLEAVAAESRIVLRLGHDRPDLGTQDWTYSSDHGPFHQAGIPFVYFGVEDHPDYHRPTDDYEHIPPGFFIGAVETIISVVQALDAHLGMLGAGR